jgi:predicted nuclease with RNAse H fold
MLVKSPAYPVVSADPNMLRSAVCQHIAPATDAAVGRWRATSPKAEQRLKGGHGLFTAIVPKDKLVQIRLELRAAHTVIGPDQPVLEIPDRAVRERDLSLLKTRIARHPEPAPTSEKGQSVSYAATLAVISKYPRSEMVTCGKSRARCESRFEADAMGSATSSQAARRSYR